MGIMPSEGQNLVFPITRLHRFSSRRTGAPAALLPVGAPTKTLPAGTYRPDFTEGKWYSGMKLYCAAIDTFDASTAKYMPGCPRCNESCSSGMSAGWAFFWILFGMLLVPCIGGLVYYFSQRGCSAESCLGLPMKIKECCMGLCGSRWERSYGSLSGDPADGMPSRGCCHGWDWRSYVPGMKGSALQEQYSGLQETPAPAPEETSLESYTSGGLEFSSAKRVEVGVVDEEDAHM